MDLARYVEHFRRRVVQDAYAEACSHYWRRRAEQFAAVGNERCDATAIACRRRAALAPFQTELEPEVVQALDEEVW